VLFVIVHSKPERFIPNLHTDPEFAAALSKYGYAADPWPAATKTVTSSGPVAIHACLLECDNTGMARLAAAHIPVDLSHGELAASDAGNYLIQLELPETCEIETGSLGTIHFKAGWYVYAGSARKNLAKRISRHLRKIRKQKHWHIDYLTPFAKSIKGLPIMSYRNLECDLAAELAALGGKAVPGFGSSDCHCPSHLYYFKDRPMGDRKFVEMLLRYRHVTGLER
jgi:sugar fermentation stimulation protein A